MPAAARTRCKSATTSALVLGVGALSLAPMFARSYVHVLFEPSIVGTTWDHSVWAPPWPVSMTIVGEPSPRHSRKSDRPPISTSPLIETGDGDADGGDGEVGAPFEGDIDTGPSLDAVVEDPPQAVTRTAITKRRLIPLPSRDHLQAALSLHLEHRDISE